MKCLQLLAILLISISVFSCKKDKKAPTEKEIVEKLVAGIGGANCSCEPAINKYTWKGSTVYVSLTLSGLCNGIIMYYNTEGKVLTLPAGTNNDDFFKEATFVKQVWKCGE